MYYFEVAPTKIIRIDKYKFTYSSAFDLGIGSVVKIEIGKLNITGVVIKKVSEPKFATKEIQSVIYDNAIPEALIQTALWTAKYYGTHESAALNLLLPRGITKKRRPQSSRIVNKIRQKDDNIQLTKDQKQAIDTISKANGTVLLHGITGSGKTEVYIKSAQQVLESGKSVILLVPEIALTTQIVDDFTHNFDNVILTHSMQTEAERHISWLSAMNSAEPAIIIGPRSALFMPIKNIGLIVIDEEHEPSYKQEQSPRYSALRVASVLASHSKAKLVLGSATPSITDYYLAKSTNSPIVQMLSTAKKSTKPTTHVVNMTNRALFKRHRFLSDKLLNNIESVLASDKQVLIFHNRRGSASVTLCQNCGWQASCPKCFVPLILHADQHKLQCHICTHSVSVPTSCPSCQSVDIVFKGIGTKLIDSELSKIFPEANIGRFDGDVDSNNRLNKRYDDIYSGKINIIIGTQVVAKGLDLPNLQLVGVIQADSGINLPDYSAEERNFQLLSQVVGRVGRDHEATTVIAQSYRPEQPSVVYGLSQDYDSFYQYCLAERQRAKFPPFTFLLKLTCIYKTEASAINNSKALVKDLRSKFKRDIEVLGPVPAFYERGDNTYRWQVYIKSTKRQNLLNIVECLPKTHWQFEIDPTSMLS